MGGFTRKPDSFNEKTDSGLKGYCAGPSDEIGKSSPGLILPENFNDRSSLKIKNRITAGYPVF